MSPIMLNRMQSHWDEARSFLQREWPHLTDADLDAIQGRYDFLISRIKSVYGGADPITQEAAIKGKLQNFLNTLEEK